MKEDYHKAAKLLKDNNELKPDKNVKLAKVNAIEQHKLSARFNVEMYPTLKIFRKGKVYEYDGARGNEWGNQFYFSFPAKYIYYLKQCLTAYNKQWLYKVFINFFYFFLCH